MKIILINKKEERIARKGVHAGSDVGPIKTGYLVNDTNDRNIGIIFKTDDTRLESYGNSEILFNEQFERDYGRIFYRVRVDKKPVLYEKIEEIMQKNERYVIYIDLELKKKSNSWLRKHLFISKMIYIFFAFWYNKEGELDIFEHEYLLYLIFRIAFWRRFFLFTLEENMTSKNLIQYYQLEKLLRDLYQKAYITFDEWYNALIELRKEYDLVFVEETN